MKKTIFAALAATTLAAMPAVAGELDYYDSESGWDILIDPSLGDGCLIQAMYQDGSLVRIGFDRDQGVGYVTAFNSAWGDIEEGAVYPVLFALDGVEYDGEAIGIWLNDVPGADIEFDNPDFLFDIAAKYTMTLYNEYGEVMAIDLAGSYRALEVALECQDEMG